MAEDLSIYTEIIIACVKLRQKIGDGFFCSLLDDKLKSFIKNFSQSGDSVAQYSPRLASVDSLLELMNQLEHLKLVEHLEVLPCQELLLRQKLLILKSLRPEVKITEKEKPAKETKSKSEAKEPAKQRFPQRSQKANQVREEVYRFIEQNGQVRTRDIVSQFGALSHRTILRSLKELVNQGLIAKQSEGGGVQYVVK